LTHFTVQAPAPGYNGFASGAVVTADGVFREHFPRGGIAVATGETPPVGIVPAETPFKIINGVLCDASGSPGVRLKCDQAALGLSTTLQYEASFHNVDVSGKPSSIAGFTFNAQPTDTPLNLLTVTPVAAAAAVAAGGGVAAAGLLSTQINDATAVGRSVLTAADAATARTALGISGSGAEWESYVNLAAFPVTGNAALEYVAQDTGKLYRWNTGTSAYVQIADKASVGLALVDNTADVNKPVSTAQQAALDGKQPVLTATAVKTSAYLAAVSDLIPCDATSAGFTVTLPTAPPDKSRVVVKKIDATTNAVTVAAAVSDVFNKTGGSTSLTLTLQFQAVQLQYQASAGIWYVISTDVPLGGLDARYAPISGGSGGITRSVVSVTSSTTLGATALTDYVALIGASGAPILPTAVGNTNRYTCKNFDSTNKTVATTSSQTIDGSTTVTLTANTSLDFISDGSNWRLI
jgi:hypothetical protein